ncbi:mechanosensitive ion channel family protein [Rhizobium sp. TH2]|nr:mechanosensitive ion channel family protein [Rhizobium sp. TH2]
MATRGLSLVPLIRNLLLVLFCAFVALPAKAQTPAAPPVDKLQALMKLMDDPDIRKWVESQKPADKVAAPAVVKPDGMEVWDSRARVKFRSAAAGFPILMSEYSAASSRVIAEARSRGMMPGIVYLSLILLAAAAGEWALRRFVRVREDATLVTMINRELVAAAAFAAITVALFFVADWPPLLRAVLRSYLIAALLFRFVLAVSRILVAAGSLSPAMYRRTLAFFGVLLLAQATGMLTVPMGINPNAVQALSFIVSLALIAIFIEAVWKQPTEDSSVRTKVLQTVFLVAIWVIWAMGFHLLCWIGLFALFLPKVLGSMEHLARAFTLAHWPDRPANSLKSVLIVYGVRTIVLAAAIGWLAFVWRSNALNDPTAGSVSNTIVSGLLKSVGVLLAADFGWRVCKALIEKKLASVSGDEPLAPEEAARRARIRTLLPIFRNALAAILLLVTILTVLSEMGVEIGPLIAGAGIFGVAIGFGSQTLVKDVISGVFYLMDDAFRVGEYIQSGSYMGTVESFSLRSVRLRHHRGPVFTVPFGELGAVQNMSRDWVIDKFRLRVTFDADIAKAKKLTKVVGAELLADEELGPLIIETVKMKGVEQINEYGVELGFAFSTKPGSQAMVRRRAYAMLRKTFAENGINFAQPTVQVGGDDKPEAAAAAMLKLAEQRKQAEAAGGGGEGT